MVGSPRSRTIVMAVVALVALVILLRNYSSAPPVDGHHHHHHLHDVQDLIQLQQQGIGVPPDIQAQVQTKQIPSVGSSSKGVVTTQLHPDVSVVPSVPPAGVSHPSAECVNLPSSPKSGVKICTHSTADDQWVSGALKRGALWEGDLVFTMKAAVETNPNMQVLDFGANIGEFTLFAAAMGRRVLAVDMLPKNVLAIQTALQMSQLSPFVTIVQNALHRDHRSFAIKEYRGNIGGTALDESKTPPVDGSGTVVKSVLLDDLLPLVNTSQPAFMKLDIETSEHHAIVGGQKFLQAVDVTFIQMEWNRKPFDVRKELITVLSQLGYVASKQCLTYDPIDMLKFEDSMNVYFVKKSYFDKQR